MTDQTPPYPRTESPEMLALGGQINELHKKYEAELKTSRQSYQEAISSLRVMAQHQKQAQDNLETIAKLIPELHEEARKPLIN